MNPTMMAPEEPKALSSATSNMGPARMRFSSRRRDGRDLHSTFRRIYIPLTKLQLLHNSFAPGAAIAGVQLCQLKVTLLQLITGTPV